MELKNNKIVSGALILIAIAIAYYLLISLPKQQELRSQQQEISLRKQTYEICLKEFEELSNNDAGIRYWSGQVVAGELTEEEMKQKITELTFAVLSKKDEFLVNCVEKRLQEYNK